MARIRQLAALTGAAALALTALATPAHAATTEIRKVSDGSLYSGTATGALTGDLVVQATILGSTTNTVCTSATLNGNVASDGDPMTINSASVTGCTGLASAITFNTPWNGRITYDAAHTGGRDGVLTLDDFSVQATVKIGFISVNCVYGGPVSANGFNGSPATVDMAGTVISRTGGNPLCPSTASIVEGEFALTGAGGAHLYVTGT